LIFRIAIKAHCIIEGKLRKEFIMFTEIRRRNEEIRKETERNCRIAAEFNPDARIKPQTVDKLAEIEAMSTLFTNELPFNPDARIVF
jgi:hypothetical protein